MGFCVGFKKLVRAGSLNIHQSPLSARLSYCPPSTLPIDPPMTGVTIENSVKTSSNILVKCWNLKGDLIIKLSCPSFRRDLCKYDINLFQETHLRPQQHHTFHVPIGYSFFAKSRPAKRNFGRAWGGVAVIVSSSLSPIFREDLSGPDFMVIQTSSLVLYNVYLLPEQSPWQKWSDIHPSQLLADSLAKSSVLDQAIIVMGDFNGRTASRSGRFSAERSSTDLTLNSRGHWILKSCMDFSLHILNGSSAVPGSHDGFTSFQPGGCSVIDYALANDLAIERIQHLTVGCHEPFWSDHAPLRLCISAPLDAFNSSASLSRSHKKQLPPSLPEISSLDRLLIHVLDSKVSDSDLFCRLYGDVYFDTPPITIYTDGSCINNGTRLATAGFGVYFGLNNPMNTYGRVHGKQTNQRGELLAVLEALQAVGACKSVMLFTDSQYVIRSIVYWAVSHSTKGWRCDNADLLRLLVPVIKRRLAPLTLRWVKGHSGNTNNDAADKLAKLGTQLELPDSYCLHDLPRVPDLGNLGLKPFSLPKISTDLPESSQITKPMAEASNAHRNRSSLRDLQATNLQLLVDASSDIQFWNDFRKMADAKSTPPTISLQALFLSFQKRMNALDPLPASFNATRLLENKSLSDSIPTHTSDSTPEQFFSRPFATEDIEWAKARITKHRPSSATGIEGVSYSDILEIDNDVLLVLINQCLATNDAPSIWFTTILTGILKKGKPTSDPDSYRTIGLESCLLKVMTLLIHLRLTEWASARNLIPPSQNGFREGYRTNNNAFILRCAVDKARSLGKTLFVGSVDITNAFPSTEQSTMWLKLHRKGAGGNLFDWIRMLYARMTYVVRLGGETSDAFKALIGILIGDPASPTLWNLYMSDFQLPSDIDDVFLDGINASNLEHADDILLMSYSARGLQIKMDAVYAWCNLNFLLINAVKSMIAIFEKLPIIIPSFWFGDARVTVTEKVTYVGVTFQTTHKNIFAEHYTTKASKARGIGHAILGVESMVGCLPPWEGRKLYMGRVDPHLVSGCEVCLDVDPARLSLLVDVQHSFLRRLLQLNSRCMVAPLYTETSIAPLQHRRILLALHYLSYLISLPTSHLAHAALADSIMLNGAGCTSWVMDLGFVLSHLPITVASPNFVTLNNDMVEDVIKAVNRSMTLWLDRELNSEKMYLLQDRLEPRKDKPPAHKTLYFRKYLSVANAEHRKALTQILLSDHCLALERLRRVHPIIPRQLRLCRFCKMAIESPEHALLECIGSSSLTELRNIFASKIVVEFPSLPLIDLHFSSVDCLKCLLTNRSITALLAKYVHDVLAFFDTVPIYTPPPSSLAAS